jgi:hypothetical protein
MFGIYQTIMEITINRPITISIYEAIGQILLYLALSTISFVIGKIVDAIQLKKAYYLRKYFLSGSAIFIIWFTLDSARQVLANKPYADLSWFGLNMAAAIILAYGAYKVSQLLDMRKKITKMLIGLPVYSKDGKWIGNVETVKKKQGIEYKSNKTGKITQIQAGEFTLSEGRIIIQTTQK